MLESTPPTEFHPQLPPNAANQNILKPPSKEKLSAKVTCHLQFSPTRKEASAPIPVRLLGKDGREEHSRTCALRSVPFSSKARQRLVGLGWSSVIRCLYRMC